MDAGRSNFKFRAPCFDTSIVTHNRLTLAEKGFIATLGILDQSESSANLANNPPSAPLDSLPDPSQTGQ